LQSGFNLTDYDATVFTTALQLPRVLDLAQFENHVVGVPCGGDLQGLIERIVTLNPIDEVEKLVQQVLAVNLQRQIANSLDAKLQGAINALDDHNANNDQAAINKLEAFINEVQAQAGGAISTTDAELLVALATAIISSLQS
jgi:hypothetical protein